MSRSSIVLTIEESLQKNKGIGCLCVPWKPWNANEAEVKRLYVIRQCREKNNLKLLSVMATSWVWGPFLKEILPQRIKKIQNWRSDLPHGSRKAKSKHCPLNSWWGIVPRHLVGQPLSQRKQHRFMKTRSRYQMWKHREISKQVQP